MLFGGLLAERAKAGPTLATLQVCFAIASIVLSAVIAAGAVVRPEWLELDKVRTDPRMVAALTRK